MKRMTKTPDTADSANAARTAQAKFTSRSREIERANGIDDSPAMVAQRKKLNSLFGGAIQRVEEEEPLQGKFETVQRIEEEEPLQGKFEAAQRVEEEEPLQGKFDTAQRVEEEEPLQGKFEAVQRVEEEEPLQGKFETAQRVEEEEPLQGKFEAASSVQLKEEAAAKPNNTGLPDNLKSGIESLSGMSMDNVRVHYNSSQPAQLNALAYAQGTDIHVAPGQEQHLPHEAWHVVQQAQGRVKPTMQMKEGVPVNDDHSLEHEADVMGERAVSAGLAQGKSIEPAPLDSKDVTQRIVIQRIHSQANWKVMNDYGSAGREVESAFIKAGYVAGVALEKKIISIIKKNGYGAYLFAHGSSSSDKDSGSQGDTNNRIQECKKFLIEWATKNPASKVSSGGSSRSGYKVSEEEMANHVKSKAEKKEKNKKSKGTEYARATLLNGGIEEREIEAFKTYYNYIPSSVKEFRELQQQIE